MTLGLGFETPCDGDYLIVDEGSRGWAILECGDMRRVLSHAEAFDTAVSIVRREMLASGFFPDVWQVNERGDVVLIDGIFGEW